MTDAVVHVEEVSFVPQAEKNVNVYLKERIATNSHSMKKQESAKYPAALSAVF